MPRGHWKTLTLVAALRIDGLEVAGAMLRYLPAYSPDLNPIEMAFSKLKTALRKGAGRTVKALKKLIGKLNKTFAPDECANYFRHAGYGSRPRSGGKCSVGHPLMRACLDALKDWIMYADALRCRLTFGGFHGAPHHRHLGSP